MARCRLRAVSSSASTTAAAPSDTREQSVRRSGPLASSGFLSETVLQNANPRSRLICASGLSAPLAWFFAAIIASSVLRSPWR